MRAHHKQCPQISVAHLRDAAQRPLAAGRVLFRRQAKKGGELARARESGDVLNAGGHRRGCHRAQAGSGHQAARPFVASSHRGDSSIAACDLLVQNMQLPHQRGECRAHAGRNRLVAFRFDDPAKSRAFLSPRARDDPNLGQMPAKCVDQLRALRHQYFARLVMHERRLVLQRAHADKLVAAAEDHEGVRPRARAAPMGHEPGESRRCAHDARRAGERDGAARRGRRGLSRRLAGKNPRARQCLFANQ